MILENKIRGVILLSLPFLLMPLPIVSLLDDLFRESRGVTKSIL